MTTIKINKVDLREARSLVTHAIKSQVVPYLQSSPGIGKSDLYASIADEYNLVLLDHRVSTMEPPDLTGLPDFRTDDQGNRYAVYAPFKDMFPLESTPIPEGKAGWLLLFDEFNHADTPMQRALYKVLLDRKIGNYKLHPNLAIALAGNLDSDNALTEQLSTALDSRIVFLEVECSTEVWLTDFAYPKQIDPRIIAYITRFKDRLHNFNTRGESKQYACPRTWNTVHKLIDGVANVDWLSPLIAGTVDGGTATEFTAFCRNIYNLPDPVNIYNDPENAMIPDDPELQWATVAMLVGTVTEDKVTHLFKYIRRYSLAFQFMYLQSMSLKYKTVNSNQEFSNALIEVVRSVRS